MLQTGNGADVDRSDHDHTSDEVDEVDEVDESHLEVVFLDYAEAGKQQRPSRQQVNKSKHLLAPHRLNCTSTNRMT